MDGGMRGMEDKQEMELKGPKSTKRWQEEK